MEHKVTENFNTKSNTDDEEVPCLMMEISRTLDQRTNGEIEVFEVETSVETVEFNMHHDDKDAEVSMDDQDLDQPLQIDTSEASETE